MTRLCAGLGRVVLCFVEQEAIQGGVGNVNDSPEAEFQTPKRASLMSGRTYLGFLIFSW